MTTRGLLTTGMLKESLFVKLSFSIGAIGSFFISGVHSNTFQQSCPMAIRQKNRTKCGFLILVALGFFQIVEFRGLPKLKPILWMGFRILAEGVKTDPAF